MRSKVTFKTLHTLQSATALPIHPSPRTQLFSPYHLPNFRPAMQAHSVLRWKKFDVSSQKRWTRPHVWHSAAIFLPPAPQTVLDTVHPVSFAFQRLLRNRKGNIPTWEAGLLRGMIPVFPEHVEYLASAALTIFNWPKQRRTPSLPQLQIRYKRQGSSKAGWWTQGCRQVTCAWIWYRTHPCPPKSS